MGLLARVRGLGWSERPLGAFEVGGGVPGEGGGTRLGGTQVMGVRGDGKSSGGGRNDVFGWTMLWVGQGSGWCQNLGGRNQAPVRGQVQISH